MLEHKALVQARHYAQAVLLQPIVTALQALARELVQTLVSLLRLLQNDQAVQVQNVQPILLRPLLQDALVQNSLALQALALPSVPLLLVTSERSERSCRPIDIQSDLKPLHKSDKIEINFNYLFGTS